MIGWFTYCHQWILDRQVRIFQQKNTHLGFLSSKSYQSINNVHRYILYFVDIGAIFISNKFLICHFYSLTFFVVIYFDPGLSISALERGNTVFLGFTFWPAGSHAEHSSSVLTFLELTAELRVHFEIRFLHYWWSVVRWFFDDEVVHSQLGLFRPCKSIGCRWGRWASGETEARRRQGIPA